ncbi:MAG: YgjP-like metallopeptidase domain-containing protein [Bacteroidales bacterium]
MSAEKIINHPIIGEYKIVRKHQSRGIRISVHRSKGVQITIPAFASYQQASQFLESKLDWVCNSLKKQKERAEKQNLLLEEDGATIELINGKIILSKIAHLPITPLKHKTSTTPPLLFTFPEEETPTTTPPKHKTHKITITTSKLAKNGGELRAISYPADAPKKLLIAAITLAIRRSAAEYLPERAQLLATKYGFKYNKLSLKNNKSNWGSCSSKNNINLNIHLMRLPSELCDYVILHELAHLKHRNHGKEFHNYLNSLCNGREKELSKTLKEFSPTLLLRKANEN